MKSSAVYRGWVRHRRSEPVDHEFRYALYMLYIDLDEAEHLFTGRWFWSFERRNLMSFRRSDYLGDSRIPLREAVLDEVERQTGRRPAGSVRMLTQLRAFGFCFNPVTFYYCFDADGRLDAIAAEITNTPWKERHCYVLRADAKATTREQFAKRFHISPFMAMEQEYAWRFSQPADQLVVHMQNFEASSPVFDATLSLERRPWNGVELARAMLRHPFMTGKVVVGIYFQALRLWMKRCPFFSHPKYSTSEASS